MPGCLSSCSGCRLPAAWRTLDQRPVALDLGPHFFAPLPGLQSRRSCRLTTGPWLLGRTVERAPWRTGGLTGADSHALACAPWPCTLPACLPAHVVFLRYSLLCLPIWQGLIPGPLPFVRCSKPCASIKGTPGNRHDARQGRAAPCTGLGDCGAAAQDCPRFPTSPRVSLPPCGPMTPRRSC